MIALVTTYFLVFYILIPGVLFRFLTSWFVPLKLFERTRTQEATFAVAVALLPFAVALFGVWHLPMMRHLPFPIVEGTAAERVQDYRRVTAILTSSDASKLLGNLPSGSASSSPQSNSPQSSDVNWLSLNRVLHRQARFLTWYFVLIGAEGVCFGLLARRYGDWQSHAARYRLRLWLIRSFILPNISEWHLLLTNFNWPHKEDIDVSVDILQNDGLLYQGRVADYFIDSQGKLTGILLENVSRFDREAYNKARETPATEQPISSAAFWKTIPGSRFYIGQSSISNLNVRFVARDQTLISLAEKILDAEDTNRYEVVVESEDEASESNSEHPDIYS
jgi:hypothetical protein